MIARAARMSFGLKIHEQYNPNLAEHQARPQEILADGIPHVAGKWDMIAGKVRGACPWLSTTPNHLMWLQGNVFDESSTTKRTYIRTYTTPNPDLGRFAVELFAWTNDSAPPPEWVIDPEGMRTDFACATGAII